ncbi:MAG: acyl-CoA carboxylase subunit beta [Myxococcota bacterium]
MSWKPEVDEIERRRARARELGGAEAVRRQHEAGRATVRERIAALVDAGSFREHGVLAGHGEKGGEGRFTPANVVIGSAAVDGRAVVVCGDDFTLRGAAYSAVGLRKSLHAEELALQRRVPLIRLLEGGGASIEGASGTRGRSGYDWLAPPRASLLAVQALAHVPVVCAALGPVAGFPAARLVASHLSLMTRDTAQVMIGGPTLVERALGERLSKSELGGPDIHLRSGVVDNLAEDEEDARVQIRRFLSYLPPHVGAAAPRCDCDDPASRREEALIEVIPRERRQLYPIRRIIEWIVDRGSFFEMTPRYGPSQVTGLARLRGHSVGVIANDCMHAGGAMTAESARKLRRFVELCDTFGLPIVSLVDEPGFMIGSRAEQAGTIRYGMEAIFAVLQTHVPWACVVLRKAFGVAAGIHLGPVATVLAWPSAESGALPVESGVALAYRREIESAPDPVARRRELEEEIAAAQSIFPRAEAFGVHDVIDPRETRPRLCEWIDEIQTALARSRGPHAYTPRP